jgi:phosphoesterase RecJ-like protein
MGSPLEKTLFYYFFLPGVFHSGSLGSKRLMANASAEAKADADPIGAVAEVIRKKDDFLVCGHVRPDGDCIGAQLGLYHLLKQLGKRAAMLNPGPILEHYLFMPGIAEIKTEKPEDWTPRVCVFVDCSDTDRVGNGFKPEGLVINIDHHNSNNYFGTINYVDPDASSVGEQIYHIAKRLGAAITPEIASCIYLAILADTGSFRFSNTVARTFHIVAELVEAGASPRNISEGFYESKKLESVRLACEVLHNLHFEFDGKLAWGEITQEMYRNAGGEDNEPESLVSEMRGIGGVEIAFLIHELRERGLRVSFRSKGQRDVSAIAKTLGGGGHLNAAGCYLLGDYDSLKKKVLDAVRKSFLNGIGGAERT